MTSRSRSRWWMFFAVAIAVASLLWWRRSGEPARRDRREVVGGQSPAAPKRASTVANAADEISAKNPAVTSTASPVEGESHIADDLNAPGGTIQRDLSILNEVFEMWQTNFPRDGNPVGENGEITAALTGDNAYHFAFIPRSNRAIDAAGELCDRWGTPFRFHQLSGRQMEIRSAGPDRKFATPDDAAWKPQ